jgi:ribosomal protein S18 acetylase RimI-like enzyme
MSQLARPSHSTRRFANAKSTNLTSHNQTCKVKEPYSLRRVPKARREILPENLVARMATTYFKRYRMEMRLDRMPGHADSTPSLPEGFELVPWSPRIVGQHADVKYESFKDEIDAHVFPCLGDLEGCRNLMREIAGRKDFLPAATWLVRRTVDIGARELQSCGTIQGLLASAREGAIQNLGVHPQCRDLGLGSHLLRAALDGFRTAGCRFVNLEVTVQNTSAIRLYERLGFRKVETLFKIAEVQYA